MYAVLCPSALARRRRKAHSGSDRRTYTPCFGRWLLGIFLRPGFFLVFVIGSPHYHTRSQESNRGHLINDITFARVSFGGCLPMKSDAWCHAHGCLRLSCIHRGLHRIGEPPDDDGDADWDAVMSMTDAEVEAELVALGVDIPAFIERVRARIAKVLAEEKKS